VGQESVRRRRFVVSGDMYGFVSHSDRSARLGSRSEDGTDAGSSTKYHVKGYWYNEKRTESGITRFDGERREPLTDLSKVAFGR
jgi:hypothetical protein